jgi:hypothetical protein
MNVCKYFAESLLFLLVDSLYEHVYLTVNLTVDKNCYLTKLVQCLHIYSLERSKLTKATLRYIFSSVCYLLLYLNTVTHESQINLI